MATKSKGSSILPYHIRAVSGTTRETSILGDGREAEWTFNSAEVDKWAIIKQLILCVDTAILGFNMAIYNATCDDRSRALVVKGNISADALMLATIYNRFDPDWRGDTTAGQFATLLAVKKNGGPKGRLADNFLYIFRNLCASIDEALVDYETARPSI